MIGKGIVSGFAATVVLSALMIAKAMMGLMPQFNVIALLAGLLGQPDNMMIGWIAHFAVGAVLWGGLFALVHTHLPGAYWLRGVLFGLGAWVGMGVVFFPLVGAGLFGMSLGMMIPVATAVLHIVYGAVLGATFAALHGHQAAVA